MNHTITRRSVDAHITEYNKVRAMDPLAPPLVFGETNSLYNQGRPGLSNTFGAALWGIDFNLYSASVGFKRVHMHQGTNYRYAAWQPVSTTNATIGTKAPYYGSIFVAAALGNLISRSARVVALSPAAEESVTPLPHDSAYATYTYQGTRLARIVILNMHSYNTTVAGHGLEQLSVVPPRPERKYTIALENHKPGTPVPVRRLLANGSDAITGITFDGWNYNWELAKGKPVRLANVTIGETVVVDDAGRVVVTMPDSSAVLLDLEEANGGGYEG